MLGPGLRIKDIHSESTPPPGLVLTQTTLVPGTTSGEDGFARLPVSATL